MILQQIRFLGTSTLSRFGKSFALGTLVLGSVLATAAVRAQSPKAGVAFSQASPATSDAAGSKKSKRKSAKTPLARVKSAGKTSEETATTANGEALPTVPSVALTGVEVVGQRRIEKDAILEKIKLKSGVTLTGEGVRIDILSVFGMGFFEDVRFDLNGTVLQITVKERPVVTKIEYQGSEEFEKKDLDDASALKPFTVLNLAKIRQAQTAITKKYEEKGYYLARADYELKPVEGRPSEVELNFHINENEKVRIRRIFFFGNEKFSSGDLKQVMITAEGHVFSWATSGGTYREDAFEHDLGVLAYFYGNEGYIQAKFAKPRVTLSQDRRYIDIMIDVEEGEQFALGDVTFNGDLLFPTEELRQAFAMKKGDVFSTGKLQEEVLKLTDKYGDQGYAFANVIPKPQIREGSKVVDLAFDIEKGEKVYWGKITVSGNSKTHDKVVRRELPFAEGELYNATKRKKGVEHVRRLGFFGNDVNFITSTPKGTNNVLDLEIRVAEKPTGTLNVSAGFGTGAGFTLTGNIAQNNLFGLGQQLSFNLSYNSRSSREFNLQFNDPKAFDTQWLMGGDLYLQQSEVGGTGNAKTYDQQLAGIALRVGREIQEDLSLSGSYKLAQSKISNPISEEIFTSPKDKDSLISSITATLAYDTRNNRIDPSGGEYFSASSEFAGLGGRVFQKYALAARVYRKPFWKFVFRTNFEYGLLTNSFNDEVVPVSERFVLGGVFSLRGYPQSSVGPGKAVTPTRPDAPANVLNYVIGGTQKLLFNQELEFPLIPEADIRWVFFFDAGNAWNNLTDRSPAFLSNYGWGIRWYSPLGPLRFEWGVPLATLPSKGDRSTEFHFIIAPTF